MSTFYKFDLSTEVINATSVMGFEETTPIQELTIPLAMEGKDIIGQAQTGTGKTAAFGIPMVEKFFPETEDLQGMVLTPTRELAVQVAEELNTIGQFKKIHALPVYGGQDIGRQIRALKNKPEIIVATPGRLMDHMRRGTIQLRRLQVVVLDEADEMLNMGFREDIEQILSYVPEQRQTMLFSATVPKPIQFLARRFMQNPEYISIKPKEVTVPQIEQYYYQVSEKQKFDALCKILDLQAPEAALVFARTKRRVNELFDALSKRGYSVEAIHGDFTQAHRDSVMSKFKEGKTEILAATDVAARGLDIGTITHVYNFDIPLDPDSYVHRIGRTGRVGRSGVASTLVAHRELDHLKHIERNIKRKITCKPVPTIDEALEGQQQLTVEKMMQIIEAGKHYPHQGLARELLETEDAVSLVAAALQLLTKEPEETSVKITSDELPYPKSKRKHEPKRNRPGAPHKKSSQKKNYKGRGGYSKKR